MKNYIDNLVAKVLKENLEEKAEIITRKIFAKENAFGDGRDKIDVAEPKGKITKADFDKLRKSKKSKTDEAEMEEGIYGSFDGKNWYDKDDREFSGNFDFEYDEEEFDEFEPMTNKHPNTKWFSKGDEGKTWFNRYKTKYGPLKVRTKKMEEAEMEEGNEFSNSRCKAICGNKKEFKVGSKTYPLKGVDNEDKKACGCSSVKESKTLTFTESELIDLIEKLVKEETEAPGIAITKKNLKSSKEVNDESLKDTTKKMKEYLKDGSKEEYNPNPQHFPMGNGELAKMDKMAYVPSEAVDEYEDAFSYPGMTNLVYDEIKPDDTKIDMYLKGDSKTGNAQKDKDGKDLGNAVSSKVGDKFKKNYDENLYGAEQMNASYKRQAQPVDVAGNITQKGSLKSIRGGKNSTEKAAKIMSQLESVDEKKQTIINEEMEKMKSLMGYNKKTQ